MLDSARVIGFALTTDYARAREFYEGKLGLRFISQDNFALVFRSGQNMVRLSKAPPFAPARHTVMGWEVEDIEVEVAKLKSRGVVFEKYPWVPDESGIWTAPNGDKIAWFLDPDGNVLSLSSHQSTAA